MKKAKLLSLLLAFAMLLSLAACGRGPGRDPGGHGSARGNTS